METTFRAFSQLNYSFSTGLKTKSSQDALLKELETSIPLTMEKEAGEPRIVCFRKHFRNLNAQIDDFLERKKTSEVRVPIKRVSLRYFNLHGENLLESLRLSSPNLKIELSPEALVVSGEKPLVDNSVSSIKQLERG